MPYHSLLSWQGAALGTMVGQMTFGKRQWEALDATMRRLIPPLHQAAVSLLPAIDADTAAFNAYMVRRRAIV
ncbi:Formimidoyltransferase-cyclodeaminase [Portunus trituberculatus]|uniref:Formimidoyltransferase-cyclodeaminase n=1 Tax=Portunus trituberculatus TaxID=210409 RepID=A0A5B7JIL0_PORTR|nr:Formimidoyltransferase-cyclodeaminase [Portunus trituberculatus]